MHRLPFRELDTTMADDECLEHDILAKAIEILSSWGIDNDRCHKILEISNQSEPVHREREAKAYLLTEVDKVLKLIFDNPENQNAFMTLPNHNDFFDGRTPIEIIEEGSMLDAQDVLTRIKALISPW